jgi:hypothetical protein
MTSTASVTAVTPENENDFLRIVKYSNMNSDGAQGSGEVVDFLEVGDQAGMGGVPAQQPLRFRARHDDVQGDEREAREVAGDLLSRDARGRDAPLAADDLGDLAQLDSLLGRGVQLRAGRGLLQRQPVEDGDVQGVRC